MVLYFDNNTGDQSYDYLAKGLADMMITDLSQVPALSVVERDKLEQLLRELKLQRTRYFDSRTAQKVGAGVGAEYAVTGAFVAMVPTIRIDVRVVRVASGQVVKSAQVTGNREDFFALQQRLTAELVAGLPLALSAADISLARNSAATNRIDDVETLRGYTHSLDLRDDGDLRNASTEMQKVVQGAPSFGLARARYAEIVRELSAAKDARATGVDQAEKVLVTEIDAGLERGTSKQRIAYRVLQGQYFLVKVSRALDKGPDTYLPPLRSYRDTQEKLIAQLRGKDPSLGAWPFKLLSGRAFQAARTFGIEQPAEISFMSVHLLERALAHLLATGVSWEVGFRPKRQVCFFKHDEPFGREIIALLKNAWADAVVREHQQENARFQIAQTWADCELAMGHPGQAVAALQAFLTQYPNAETGKFDSAEARIRDILSGRASHSSCDYR